MFLDFLRQLNAADGNGRRLESLEPEHRGWRGPVRSGAAKPGGSRLDRRFAVFYCQVISIRKFPFPELT